MIYGDNFIFIRNPKTGSTSCATALRAAGAKSKFHHHSPLMEVEMKPCQPKFCAVVVRNPYDRMVSAWAGNTEGEGESFLEWLASPEPWLCGPSIDGKRVPQIMWTNGTDWIMDFDFLPEQFEEFTSALGLDAKLPHQNKSEAREGMHYRDIIDGRSREIIEDRFAPDFEVFGFKW